MGWWTNAGKRDLALGGVTGREFRLILAKTAPASAAAAADLNFTSQIVANELTVSGYARRTLASVVTAEDDTNDRATIDATDPATYTGLATGETIVGGWIVRRITNGTDTDATDILWTWHALSPTIPTNGGDVTIALNALGFATIT